MNLGQSGAWVIESDSDNTFELVSPPLRFDTIRSAYAFKAKLVQALRDSVSVTLPPQNVDMQLEDIAADDAPPIVACLFSDWQERFRLRLHSLLSEAAQSGKLELDRSLRSMSGTTWAARTNRPAAPALRTCSNT